MPIFLISALGIRMRNAIDRNEDFLAAGEQCDLVFPVRAVDPQSAIRRQIDRIIVKVEKAFDDGSAGEIDNGVIRRQGQLGVTSRADVIVLK